MQVPDTARIKEIKQFLAELKGKGFTKQSSIHSPESVRLARELKFDKQTIEWMEKGLYIDIPIEEGTKYEDKNNVSFEKFKEHFKPQLSRWLEEGKVIELEEKPNIINPLSIVEKQDGRTKEWKYRVVIDQSRLVNQKIEVSKTKLDHLTTIEKGIERDMFMTSFDLTQMYHQIKLTEETAKFFCFQVEDEVTGKPRYYQWKVLAFGNKKAVEITKDILKPVVRILREMGIVVYLYIDDGLIGNKNPRELKVETELALELLEMLGWGINYKKSELQPQKELLVQGLWIDTEMMHYKLPLWKRESIDELLSMIIAKARTGRVIPVKEMASLYGKLAAVEKAVGNIVAFTRQGQNLVGRAIYKGRGPNDPNWNAKVQLSEQAVAELEEVRSQVERTKSFRIQNEGQPFSIGIGDLQAEDWPDLGEEEGRVMVSDASDKIGFAFEQGTFKVVEEHIFSREEQDMGSGQRELRAVLKTLQKNRKEFSEGPRRVYWVTDSKNVHSFLKRGSKKEHIQQDVIKIKKLEAELNIRVSPIWKPREFELIRMADEGSKMYKSTDEWSIDKRSFKQIQTNLRVTVTVDGFATRENRQVEKFFSRYPQIGTSGLNFFSMELSDQEVYWLCPPVKEVVQVIHRIREDKKKLRAIVSFPNWKGADFWPKLLSSKNRWKRDVQGAVLSYPQYRSETSTVFRGQVIKFGLVSIYINGEKRKKGLKLLF